MSKTVLSRLIAERHQMPKAKADEIVDTMLDGIKNALISQGSISFVGFGRFHAADRAPRTGRNPSTGGKVQIPARKVIKFTPGDPLKKAINPEK
jgi:nucleoid DNA-binding protein